MKSADVSWYGLRIIGVDDGSFVSFPRGAHSHSILCCVEMNGAHIERVFISNIEVDGLDATDKLLSLIRGSEAEAVILGGITFAGFNIVDPSRIFDETGIPVIVYSGKKPDNQSMLLALKSHFNDWERRWRIIESLGGIYKLAVWNGAPEIYFEVVGHSSTWAEAVLKRSAMISRIPEPVRVAGLIARGLSPAFC